MTESTNHTPDMTEQFTEVLKQLAEFKDYFVSKDSVNDLVDWLHEETGINKASLKLAINYILPLIIAIAAKAGSAVAVSWKRKILEHLTQYQWCFEFTRHLS